MGEETYRVSGNVDALLLGVLDELQALEDGVTLNLVGSGDNIGGLNKSLNLQ